MKAFIVASCLLAIASAGYVAHHIPVLDHHGFQLDTPEVAAAKAAHFAAHAEANARIGAHGVYGLHGAVAPVAVAHGYAPAYHGAAYHGPIHIPVIGPHGVPLDTPEVVAARAHHAAAVVEAQHRNGDAYHHGYGHYRKRRGLVHTYGAAAVHAQHIPVIGPHGVPLETPEVAAARAQHLAAHAGAHHGHIAHAVAAPVAVSHGYAASYHGPQHIPVIGPHGVPLDTPEVVAARAHHAAAVADVQARDGGLHHVVHAAPASYAGHHAYAPHVPVLDHHGFQLDTPEVAAAKAHHFAAHAEASARNGLYHHY